MSKYIKQIAFILCVLICLGITECQKEEETEETRPEINAMDSTITGDTYTASFYTNDGEKYMEAKGSNIQLFPLSYDKYASVGTTGASWTEYTSMLQVNIDRSLNLDLLIPQPKLCLFHNHLFQNPFMI